MSLFVVLATDSYIHDLLKLDLDYIDLNGSRNERWCRSRSTDAIIGYSHYTSDISHIEYRHLKAVFLCSCKRLLHNDVGRRQADRSVNKFNADVILCNGLRSDVDHKHCLDNLRNNARLVTLKDLMMHISDQLRHLKAAFGAIIRDVAMPFCQSSHGCEVESVSLRDHLCCDTVLYGMPTLPFHIVDGSLVGGCEENDLIKYSQSSFIRKMISLVEACEVDTEDPLFPIKADSGVEASRRLKIKKKDTHSGGSLTKRFGFAHEIEGIIKLTALLTSVWRWDEVCVYFGGSPGTSIYYTLHMRGFRNNRAIIVVDPRPPDPRLKEYSTSTLAKKRNIHIRFITGLVPQCFPELRDELSFMLKKTNKTKFFIFSDIRTDESAEKGRQNGDWSDAHAEDFMAYESIQFFISMPGLERYILSKSLCKIKVSPLLSFAACCDQSLLLLQFTRYDKKYELRLYSRGSCHYRSHLPFTDRCRDYSELMEVWDRKPFWVKSKQCALIAQLDIIRANGFDMTSRPNDLRMDLFYATNSCNRDADLYGLMCKSDISTFWVGGSNPYADFRLDVDASRLFALSDRSFFYGSHFVEFLNKGVDTYRPQYVAWEDSFLICVSHRLLVELGIYHYLFANTFGNCQTFGFRRLLNEERSMGCVALENIDVLRRELDGDHFSGHLIGMSILSVNKRRYFDIYRWLMLIIGNWITNGLIELSDSPLNGIWLESMNQTPECRDDVQIWHSFGDITSTLDLLVEKKILIASVAESMRTFITKRYFGIEQSRAQLL